MGSQLNLCGACAALMLLTPMLLLGCGGCRKQRNPIEVVQGADLTNLAVVVASPDRLLGIDTTTFQVRARILCREMHIDKAARSASGEVILADDDDNGKLYVLGTDGHVARSARIVAGPNSPFVYEDLVCVGSRYLANGGAQLNVYSLRDLRLLRRHAVRGILLREEDFCGADGKIYTYYSYEPSSQAGPVAFPVVMDATTLDTTHIRTGELFQEEYHGIITLSFAAQRQWLFIASDSYVALYNLEERRVVAHRSLNELLERVGLKEFLIATKPVIADGFVYMLCAYSEPGNGRTICWVKFSMENLDIVEAKRLFQDGGAWAGADDFLTFGRFYVVEADLRGLSKFRATFIDIRTGEVVAKVVESLRK